MKNKIWTEKYRPKNIESLTNEEIKKIIICNQNVNNLPHLLFYGPAGTGKTSAALAIVKYLFYNPKYKLILKKIYDERLLELNASDERGINIVRDKIKIFAMKSLSSYENIPNFKFIILDEADALTVDSQYALRRIIEQYSHLTRFIIICNYISKIISPLISRFHKIKFISIKYDKIYNILNNIILKEKIKLNNQSNIINFIINYTNNDLRKSIFILQHLHYIKKINQYDSLISIEDVKELLFILPQDRINILYNLMINKLKNYKVIYKFTHNLLIRGYSYNNIINEISEFILNFSIAESIKVNIFINISSICYNLSIGSNELIQLISLIIYINNCITN